MGKKSKKSIMASSASSSAAAPPPPQPPAAAKKGFLRRILPFLLTANLAVGGYFLNPHYQYHRSVRNDDEVTNGFRHVVDRLVSDATTRIAIKKEAEKWRLKIGIFRHNASKNAVKNCQPVYVLARTWKKGPAEKDEVPSSPVVSKETANSEKIVSTESLPPLAKARPPIPEDEQRELYKWILEEMRKVKPRDSAEKKKIDEDKALLKQVLRAESIPSL